MHRLFVWDPLVRLFHWSLAVLFLTNAFIVDDDGDLHIYIGFAVWGWVVMRIIWGFVGTQYSRFSSFPPSRAQSKAQLQEILSFSKKQHIGHTPLAGLMIYNLLVSIFMLCLSGYWMTTDMFWGMEWPEELHEFFAIWAKISVGIHIAAVVFESYRTKTNLPKAMITGYKNIRK